jgi:DNA repair protein RadC
MFKVNCAQRIVQINFELQSAIQNKADSKKVRRLRNRLHYWRRKQRMAQRNGLYVRDVQGQYQPASSDSIQSAALWLAEQGLAHGTALTSVENAKKALQLRLAFKRHEVFVVVYLDCQHRIIECVDVFRGTLNAASVYPREVAYQALQFNAESVMLCHNHPSGKSTPSEADKRITESLRKALAMFDIHVLDHLVIGEDVYSFAEHGLI